MKSWFSIQNKADAPAAEIYLFDEIGGWGVTSAMFVSAFNQIPKGRKIELKIDSRGGDVDTGLAIYDVVQQRKEDVTVRVSGIAASIASVIICGASKVIMPAHALLLIHNAWAPHAEGEASELRKRADWLDKICGQILAIYVAKTGKSKEELKAVMDAETLLTAAEAKALGFCDEVEGETKKSKALIQTFCRFKGEPTFAAGNPEEKETPPPNPQNTLMKKLLAALVEAKLITSADLNEDAAAADFSANWKATQTELTDGRNAVTALENAKAKAADEAIQAAIDLKKIKNDDATKAFWKGAFKADAAGAKTQLEAIEAPKAPRGAAPLKSENKSETKTDEKNDEKAAVIDRAKASWNRPFIGARN